jgi:DNA-binding LacI/PurR family transcriptional regulator
MPPQALVVMNERALPGVLQALASRNLRIPEHVSVVSAVTSASAAAMMIPELTSADAPSLELARLAVTNLVRSIEDPLYVVESVVLPCHLILRASTGPASSSVSQGRKHEIH